MGYSSSLRVWVVVLIGVPANATAADPPAVRWRTDYNAARKEAAEKNLPILLKFGSDNCFYCRKQDATTLADPTVIGLLAGQFVPVAVDARSDGGLGQALRVTLYPTLVLAGAEGKIHQTLQGYQTSEQLTAALRATLMLAKAELVVKAAAEPAKPPPERARELLALAEEEFRGEKYAACLDHCDYLAAVYADRTEGFAAAKLAASIKADPARLAKVADQLTLKAAAAELAVADAYLKTGDHRAATAGYEKVLRMTAAGRPAEVARAELVKLQTGSAVPAALRK